MIIYKRQWRQFIKKYLLVRNFYRKYSKLCTGHCLFVCWFVFSNHTVFFHCKNCRLPDLSGTRYVCWLLWFIRHFTHSPVAMVVTDGFVSGWHPDFYSHHGGSAQSACEYRGLCFIYGRARSCWVWPDVMIFLLVTMKGLYRPDRHPFVTKDTTRMRRHAKVLSITCWQWPRKHLCHVTCKLIR